MARGREVLATIPGVRRVFTGWAVQSRAAYKFCWLVQLAHARVIDSYRDHPDHIAFADGLFRPIAGNRVTIDFVEMADAPTAAGAAVAESAQA
jgi:fructose-bisphosphate aldolase class II